MFMFDNMKSFDCTLFLRAEFGQCVFHDNGELNRAALRTIIFEVRAIKSLVFKCQDKTSRAKKFKRKGVVRREWINHSFLFVSGRGATSEVEPDYSPRDLQRDDLGGGTLLLLDMSPFNCSCQILLLST